MLTIRKDQIAILNEGLRNQFLVRMISHIAGGYPKQFQEWGEQKTHEFVLAGIDKAAIHGIDAEGAIAVLIELMIEVGSGFEHSPDRKWVHNILTHSTIPGQVKVDLIRERIRSRTQGRVVTPHRSEAQ